jgi:prepilin-type N-terminal cleavage/methylation domain-containing protein
MTPVPRRFAYTLIELLIVIALIAVLLALGLPAIQKVRAASARSACADNLRQIGVALHGYHASHGVLPQAYNLAGTNEAARRSWAVLILPHLEQDNVQKLDKASQETQPVAVFLCPAEPRGRTGGGYTDYLAVEGTDYRSTDSVLYNGSKTQWGDIRDGLETTVVVGERPGLRWRRPPRRAEPARDPRPPRGLPHPGRLAARRRLDGITFLQGNGIG